LTVLSSSLADAPSRPGTTARREPSIKRKRLHILYLLNDILYHAKYRAADASVCSKLQPILVDLFGSAASFTGCPKHQHKIADLLELWEEKDYYSREYINKLRETVKNAAEAGSYVEGSETAGEEARGAATKAIKSTPYVMPATHGDPSTPWYDLPAGNLMPHIVPNSTRPINPGMIKPLQFVAGPADGALVAAVQGLLDDVKGIFEGEADLDERPHWDIDELGQPIVLDEITGEVIEGEGYYGWSLSFCEKMKRRRKGLDAPDEERDRDRDRALSSRSRSSSRARKRRRYSGSSDGSSPAGQRASHRRRAYSSSRSPSPAGRRGIGDGRSRSRSRSKTYSRSRSRSRSRSPDSHRRAGTRSFHPPPDRHEGFPPPPPPGPGFIPPPVSSFQNGFNAPFPPPPPNIPYPGQGQQQYGSWPVPPPPPPPPHYSGGPWPPPPPPGNFQQGGYPPPPPPQGGWAPPGQHGGSRGYNGGWNGSNGRGGRGGNRGRGWS
jgi:hypothetical protein